MRCSLDGETIHFYRSSIDAIPALLNFLEVKIKASTKRLVFTMDSIP